MQDTITLSKRALEELREGSTVNAILLFMGFSLLVAWLFASLQPLPAWLNYGILHLVGHPPAQAPEPSLPQVLFTSAIPLLLTGLALYGLRYWYLRSRAIRQQYQTLSPEPKAGLLVVLSSYKIRDTAVEGVPATFGELGQLVQDPTVDRSTLRAKIFATNWGPLWAAAELHGPTLKHCWIVTTKGARGSHKQQEAAAALVKRAANPYHKKQEVYCHPWDDRPREGSPSAERLVIADVNDILHAIDVIKYIYDVAIGAANLRVDQVIADFTGGTAQITAGMVLATLDDARSLQYLRQDRSLLDLSGSQPRALTPEEIQANGILMEVKTFRSLVDERLASRP